MKTCRNLRIGLLAFSAIFGAVNGINKETTYYGFIFFLVIITWLDFTNHGYQYKSLKSELWCLVTGFIIVPAMAILSIGSLIFFTWLFYKFSLNDLSEIVLKNQKIIFLPAAYVLYIGAVAGPFLVILEVLWRVIVMIFCRS